MPVMGFDTFDRIGATLGGNWVEQTDGPLATDMATNNVNAIIQTNAVHVATFNDSLQADNFCTSWVWRVDDNQDIGVVLRFVNGWSFYAVIAEEDAGTQYLSIYKVSGGLFVMRSRIAIPGWTNGDWHRISAQVVGSRIKAWIDGFGIAALDWTDPASPITTPGRSGLISMTNDATGLLGGIAWNDYAARDGEADQVFVDYTGAAGFGFGSAAHPDPTIGHALANVGAQQHSTITVVNATVTVNVLNDNILIGDDKFSSGAYSFPTYDPSTGEAIGGNPNLIIEGRAARTTLDLQSDDRIFMVQDDATGILFRNFDYGMSGFAAFNARFIETAFSTDDHSIAIDKCSWRIGIAGAAANQAPVRIRSYFEQCAIRYTFHYLAPGIFGFPTETVLFAGNVQEAGDLDFSYNVLKGRAVFGFNGDSVGMAIGKTWTFDHNHFLDISLHAIELLDYGRINGAVIVENNLFSIQDGGAATVAGTSGFGGVLSGTMVAHHNSYHRVTTPRAIGFVTDGGAEIDVANNPAFTAGPLTWAQAMNLVLPVNYRPTDGDYTDNADDTNPNIGRLDRGALQGVFVPDPAAIPDRIVPTRRKGTFCVRVTYDPGGPNETDLSGLLRSMRPLRQEKDILLRKYHASDTEIEFIDPDNRFVDVNPASFLVDAAGVRDWLNKPVTIEYADDSGATIMTFRGFCLAVRATRGRGYLRLGNRFQQLFQRSMGANDTGTITNVAGNPGLPPAGNYIGDLTIGPGCGIETWTFTFTGGGGSTTFGVVGSETGADGSGTTVAPFTSNSGRITVNPADWVGGFNGGDVTSIKTVWRATATTVVTVYEELLLSPVGGDLTAADLDASITDLQGTAVDQVMNAGFVIDTPSRVIDVMEEICLHALAVATEKANATIGIYAYVPKVEGSLTDVLCKHDDLMSAKLTATPIYNQFTYEHTYDEITEQWGVKVIHPPSDAENPSLLKYGLRVPAPKTIQLRGFNASNAGWVLTLGAQNLTRWGEPRALSTVELKAHRLGVEIDELFWIDSELPEYLVVVEPRTIQKSVAPEPRVSMELFDVQFYVQPDGACGYAVHDSGHRYDDCWVYF